MPDQFESGFVEEHSCVLSWDIYETCKEYALMRQSELIVEYLSRFTTNYEEDKNFGCIITDKSIDYLYRKKMVLSVDTEWQQGDGCLFFNYRVYGELDE